MNLDLPDWIPPEFAAVGLLIAVVILSFVTLFTWVRGNTNLLGESRVAVLEREVQALKDEIERANAHMLRLESLIGLIKKSADQDQAA